MKRLEEKRVLREVDKKTGPTKLYHLRARDVEVSIQAGEEVRSFGVMPDVTDI